MQTQLPHARTRKTHSAAVAVTRLFSDPLLSGKKTEFQYWDGQHLNKTELTRAAKKWPASERVIVHTAFDFWGCEDDSLHIIPRLRFACSVLGSTQMTTLLEAIAMRAGVLRLTQRLVAFEM